MSRNQTVIPGRSLGAVLVCGPYGVSKVGQQMCSWQSFGGHLASSWIVLRHVGLKAKELPFQYVAVVTRQCLKTLDGSGSLLAA